VNNGECSDQSVCTNNIGGPPTCGPCVNGFIGNNFCSGGESRNSKSAGLIAGVTIGGFLVLLGLIALIFHFTKDKAMKKKEKEKQQRGQASSSPSSSNFELSVLSRS